MCQVMQSMADMEKMVELLRTEVEVRDRPGAADLRKWARGRYAPLSLRLCCDPSFTPLSFTGCLPSATSRSTPSASVTRRAARASLR